MTRRTALARLPHRTERTARIIRPLDQASHALESAGMSRLPAITHELVGADKLWLGMTILEPGTSTGPHHHGDRETGVYMVAGRIRLRWGERLEEEEELAVGDVVFLPPGLSHEAFNPSSDTPAVWVIVLNDGQEFVPLAPDGNGVYEPVEPPFTR